MPALSLLLVLLVALWGMREGRRGGVQRTKFDPAELQSGADSPLTDVADDGTSGWIGLVLERDDWVFKPGMGVWAAPVSYRFRFSPLAPALPQPPNSRTCRCPKSD